ncbi:hypothetical protein E4U61_002141 [Claviceps capensis]|nr:hypothetical protein E4U61_002141 [Claviceps capensis]
MPHVRTRNKSYVRDKVISPIDSNNIINLFIGNLVEKADCIFSKFFSVVTREKSGDPRSLSTSNSQSGSAEDVIDDASKIINDHSVEGQQGYVFLGHDDARTIATFTVATYMIDTSSEWN